MNTKFTYKVAEEFSPFPGGRKRKRGSYSGEQFREDVALPLLAEHEYVVFDLSGSAGYSSGFLDEAFGELGSIFGENELKRRIEIIASDDPDAVEIAWRRIEEASLEQKQK